MKTNKFFTLFIATVFTLSICSCGTILYPERKGTIKGEIDPAVAILDGVGLLFFLVPGVIAFAVDFNNGAIYLPHGQKGALGSNDSIDVIKAKQPITEAYLEKVIHDQLHTTVNLHASNVTGERMNSLADIYSAMVFWAPLQKTNIAYAPLVLKNNAL